MKHWLQRRMLLWKLIKANGHARELELEWQRHQQRMHDLKYAGDAEYEKYLFEAGFVEGIKWVLSRKF